MAARSTDGWARFRRRGFPIAGARFVLHYFYIRWIQPGQLDCSIDRLLDESNLVDQSVRPRLIGGVDLTGGELVESVGVFLEFGSALLDNVLKPREALSTNCWRILRSSGSFCG